MNGTLQDRLVKELRLRGISSMADANAYAAAFIADFNARFAKVPRSDFNAIGRYTTMRTYGASFAGANGTRSPIA
ncbi:hypothetical protein [Cupriavidus pauculus]|uniref:hypothetical protein n=1 Tax=Cupriavidus pauculus TaxID=82633 RepID=UPI00168B3698